ncbi:MAG: 6-phosphofructokinase [Anaerolineales bacterium]|nr:6-phosphofructokinase [Anaerolineales bacterium]
MATQIGILTAGGDSPGLNAAIRAVGKAALGRHEMNVIGFRDGFRGLMENRSVRFDRSSLSGILTMGGTILGTSRDKPHKMPIGSRLLDMTDVMVENYHKHHLDCLVCIGGGGTHKNAYKLFEKGLNIVTLPKTIDNDVWGSDHTLGFDTAMEIATEAIDRLHSTAHSHHRIIVVEIMGHNAGWLALGAGIAGGADVILIPEIPYDVEVVSQAILRRLRRGTAFSIVAVSEGAISTDIAARLAAARQARDKAATEDDQAKAKAALAAIEAERKGHTMHLSEQLEALTGLESRVTILGHVQRGGTPSAQDRLLASRLGTACVDFISQGQFGIMVASRGRDVAAVPLAEMVGRRKTVPLDHRWIKTARDLRLCLGD